MIGKVGMPVIVSLWSVSLSLFHTWCKRAWDSTNQCQFDESVWKLVLKGTTYRKKMEQRYLSILKYNFHVKSLPTFAFCYDVYHVLRYLISSFLSCRSWIPRRWMAISIEVQHSQGCWEILTKKNCIQVGRKQVVSCVYFPEISSMYIHVDFGVLGMIYLENQPALLHWWALEQEARRRERIANESAKARGAQSVSAQTVGDPNEPIWQFEVFQVPNRGWIMNFMKSWPQKLDCW